MRSWKWAAGAIGIAALGAFAVLWALTAADVLRWGATSTLHDRIIALEEQAAQATQERVEEQFIVVNIGIESGFCITFTAPGGPQERCAPAMEEFEECWLTAVLGEPLPTCWRSWPP